MTHSLQIILRTFLIVTGVRVFIIGDYTVGLLNEPLDVTENFLKARIDLKLHGLEAPFQTLS